MKLLESSNKENILKAGGKDTLHTNVVRKELLWTFSEKLQHRRQWDDSFKVTKENKNDQLIILYLVKNTLQKLKGSNHT